MICRECKDKRRKKHRPGPAELVVQFGLDNTVSEIHRNIRFGPPLLPWLLALKIPHVLSRWVVSVCTCLLFACHHRALLFERCQRCFPTFWLDASVQCTIIQSMKSLMCVRVIRVLQVPGSIQLGLKLNEPKFNQDRLPQGICRHSALCSMTRPGPLHQTPMQLMSKNRICLIRSSPRLTHWSGLVRADQVGLGGISGQVLVRFHQVPYHRRWKTFCNGQ
jgi:hypothetical protein